MRLIMNEKPNQSADWAIAMGASPTDVKAGKPKGFIELDGGKTCIAWAFGHMAEMVPMAVYLGVDPKEDAYPHWKDPSKLPILPAELKLEPIKSSESQLKVLQRLLKRATEVVIAGDCDNEGELIQVEILEYCNWSGPTKRAIFNTSDVTSVKKAMANLVPAEQTRLRAEAAAGRRDADWLIGMNLSPMVTTSLVPQSVQFVFPIGRVKSAVQRIVYDRDMEIENFKPQTYYTVTMTVETTAGTVILTHAPEEKILDKAIADQIAAAAAEWSGALAVKTQRKRKGPPKMFSRSELEMAASRELRFSLQDTEDTLQPLYEQHYVSYPRTSGRYLKESMIEDVPALMTQAKALHEYASHVPAKPLIRKGKNGTFSDADLAKASHEAIGPNVNTVPHNLGKLSDKQMQLYLLIYRRYLEQFLPDYEYDSTAIETALDAGGAKRTFKVTGSVPVVMGWRALKAGDDEEEEQDAEAGQPAAGKLPPIENGMPGRSVKTDLLTKNTEPPDYFTEATLVADMKNAAKHVKHPALAKMLEEAEGIGTEATRKDVIGELYKYELLIKDSRGRVKTTAATRAQVPAVMAVAPEIMDPGLSALFEENASRIARGEITRAQHRQMVNQWLQTQVGLLRQAKKLPPSAFGAAIAKKAAEYGKPTDGQLTFADMISSALKVAMPAAAKTDRTACSTFIEEHKEAFEKWKEANPGVRPGGTKPSAGGRGAKKFTSSRGKTGGRSSARSTTAVKKKRA